MHVSRMIQDLRTKGLRLTPQRMVIFRALAESDQHLNAYEILEQLKPEYPMLSLATVYKTLELLKDMCKITPTGLGDGNRYEANPEPHVNLVCTRCGRIQDFLDPAVEKLHHQVSDHSGFSIHGARVEYFGVCPACQAEGQDG
ncbi:MAG: hypothetical protein A2Z04_03270 [Chloroflexi bacterium RBG_16_57_9]|nr:MAG: hypothetical protein A2Z04_03270 [Chloroflexi bacterium RBG_16_57_9]